MYNFFLFFLAIIPFIIIGIFFFYTKSFYKPSNTHGLCSAYTILTVRNNEDSIEGELRSIAWRVMTGIEVIPDLIVLDLDSRDNTFQIVKKLSKEYSFLHPMSKSEYIRFISDM